MNALSWRAHTGHKTLMPDSSLSWRESGGGGSSSSGALPSSSRAWWRQLQLASSGGEPSDDSSGDAEGSGSWVAVGIFFLLLLIAFVAWRMWRVSRWWRDRARSAKVLDEIEMEFVNDDVDDMVMDDIVLSGNLTRDMGRCGPSTATGCCQASRRAPGPACAPPCQRARVDCLLSVLSSACVRATQPRRRPDVVNVERGEVIALARAAWARAINHQHCGPSAHCVVRSVCVSCVRCIHCS